MRLRGVELVQGLQSKFLNRPIIPRAAPAQQQMIPVLAAARPLPASPTHAAATAMTLTALSSIAADLAGASNAAIGWRPRSRSTTSNLCKHAMHTRRLVNRCNERRLPRDCGCGGALSEHLWAESEAHRNPTPCCAQVSPSHVPNLPTSTRHSRVERPPQSQHPTAPDPASHASTLCGLRPGTTPIRSNGQTSLM